MKVFQLIPDIYYGDAVGNDCLAIDKLLTEAGFYTEIFAINIDDRLKNYVKKFDEIRNELINGFIIYHVSTGSEISEWILGQNKCKKIMIYHNITEPDFFIDYNDDAYNLCKKGLGQVKSLNSIFDAVISDSEFNKTSLLEMGYSCPITVLPILIPFDDYKKIPDESLLKKYSDDFVNIIFVGIIVPNKKQEDIIAIFHEYQKNFNLKSRLFLVGNPIGYETYNERLKDYVKQLGVKNVVFTGSVKFQEILAYYDISDLFLCMSEHEGFCVPLVESMFFNVPIVAYDSSAISWTLGDSGFLLSEKNFLEVAAVINRILTDKKLKTQIIENQKERLVSFSYEKTKKSFLTFINGIINNEREEKNCNY